MLGGDGKPPFEVLIDAEANVVRDKYGTKLFPGPGSSINPA